MEKKEKKKNVNIAYIIIFLNAKKEINKMSETEKKAEIINVVTAVVSAI